MNKDLAWLSDTLQTKVVKPFPERQTVVNSLRRENKDFRGTSKSVEWLSRR